MFMTWKNRNRFSRLDNKSFIVFNCFQAWIITNATYRIVIGVVSHLCIIKSCGAFESTAFLLPFIFNYNRLGRIISCDKYVATTSNDFTLKLSEQEKSLFYIVDTSKLMRANYTKIRFSEIKGFRKPFDKEITHSFPLINRGGNLPVQ